MDKKFYTFLIFPGAHGNLHKIRLPFYVVHMVLAFSVVGIMTIAALANSYARMLLKVSNYNNLRTEREALKTQNRSLENAVTTTNAKLDSLQSLASEVALTYGFGEARRPRFPEAALSLATQTNSTLESSYRASLYAFNLIRNSSLVPSRQSTALGIFPSADLGRETVPLDLAGSRAGHGGLWPALGSFQWRRRLPFRSGYFAPRTARELRPAVMALSCKRGWDSGYGNAIMVDHGFGMTTKYGHLSKIFVVVGQEVKRGQVIGAVGMTGKDDGSTSALRSDCQRYPCKPDEILARVTGDLRTSS